MTVHENITELIGHTPLVELTNYERAHELPATLIGKVESFNPTAVSYTHLDVDKRQGRSCGTRRRPRGCRQGCARVP